MPIDDAHPDLLDRYLAVLAAVADTSVAPRRLLTYLGTLIDASHSLGRLEGTEAAIAAGARLLKADTTPHERALAHYFLANAHEDARTLRRTGWDLEAWEQPEIA